jgi:hypothetical protein
MLKYFNKLGLVVFSSLLLALNATAQYKYTRYSIDLNGGFSFPKTSISGTAGGLAEIGFRLAPSRYLSGKLAIGAGTLAGSQSVTNRTGQPDDVNNYTKFDANYYYFTGSGILNLERIFKLRNVSRTFNRLNVFLVVGAGYMYPNIKVNRVDGQFKNYKNNVRFIHNSFGLDFKYFLSNRFDLNFGTEYKLVQTYYLDGAYSDKVFDGMINGYVGIAYNIGGNADRKHLEWFNLDGKIDVIYVPFKEEDKKDVPIVKENQKIQDSLNLAQNELPKDQLEKVDSSTIVDPDMEPIAKTNELENDTTFKKTGRHTDIRYTNPKDSLKAIVIAPIQTTPTTLNAVAGVVQPLGKYNVIVGTYKGSKYAYAFRDKLRKQGFEAALFKDNERSKMVRVAVYFGDDRQEANKQLRRYLTKFNQQAWIHVFPKK